MIWTCSMYKNECIRHFDGQICREESTWNKYDEMGKNIKRRFKEIGCKDVDWTCLANFFLCRDTFYVVGHDRLVIEASR
jgi:hypothetical protein